MTSTLDPAFKAITYLPNLPVHWGWYRTLSRNAHFAGAVPEGVTRETATCRGDNGDVSLLVTSPQTRRGNMPVVLWIHGGGYVIGSNKMGCGRANHYAEEFGMCTVLPEYRLAPEHPAPAAIDDCLAAWKWILDNAEERGWDVNRLIIYGQSAGGGLAAALVQRIHDDGGPQPILQFLLYPMLDDRTVNRTDNEGRRHYVWSRENNKHGWAMYLGSEPTQAVIDAAVPARRRDLSGLPPAWIGVGTDDLFHDEDVAYARRLKDAGVEVELDVVDGAFHAFDVIFPNDPKVVRFRQAQDDVMRRFLGSDSS